MSLYLLKPVLHFSLFLFYLSLSLPMFFYVFLYYLYRVLLQFISIFFTVSQFSLSIQPSYSFYHLFSIFFHSSSSFINSLFFAIGISSFISHKYFPYFFSMHKSLQFFSLSSFAFSLSLTLSIYPIFLKGFATI